MVRSDVMRGVVALSCLCAALGPGCQSSKRAPGAGSAATGASGASAASGAPGTMKVPEGEHVMLPRSPAGAPVATHHPLDRAALDRLAATSFSDFERQDRASGADFVEFRHTTRSRPVLAATIVLAPCNAQHPCPAMDLAAWTAQRTALLAELPAELAQRPETRFEIAAHPIGGAPAISTYALGYHAGNDDRDQPSTTYVDAYTLYYNDGANQLRVMAHYVDDPVGGVEPLLAVAPPEDLERIAIAFASYYLHTWH
jgi:hypothetical protein